MEDSHCRELSRTLKAEFKEKRKRLHDLQDEVNSLLRSNDIRTPFSPLSKEGNEQTVKLETFDELVSLRRKLEKMTCNLKTIHTEGSKEHIHLKSVHEELIDLHKRKDTNTLNTTAEFQRLVRLVTDLQSDHEWNCQLKAQLENRINQAYRRISKQQTLLSRRFSESSDPKDKENANRLLDVTDFISPQKLPLQDLKCNASQQEVPLVDRIQMCSLNKPPLRDKK